MIIVKLQGGLGNQMFQYAAGKSLAQKHAVPLFIDTSFFETNSDSSEHFTARNFELNAFKLNYTLASKSMLDDVFRPGILKNIQRKFFSNQTWLYTEKGLGYDNGFEKIIPPVWIDGYWQSERYFKQYEPIIRTEFSFNTDELPQQLPLLDQIRSSNSVGVHFRRGDYISSKIINNHHGECSLSYYKKAIALLNEHFTDLKFFAFSDDTAWVKQNLSNNNLHIVEQHSLHDYPDWADMFLMSQCRHNIIANSTFSWWAAWLNSNPQKMIIAPKNWFRNPPDRFKLDDLLPTQWQRL
jgi:hypothetical protein